MSIGAKNCSGSAVWITTGTFASAHTCQIGSRSGSSIFRREPSAFVSDRPSPFTILSPIAPSFAACRQVVDDAEVELVHLLDHLLDILRADPRVIVNVDRRKLRLRNEVFGGN